MPTGTHRPYQGQGPTGVGLRRDQEDSPTGERDAEEMALHSPVLSTIKSGGPDWERDRQRANIGRRAGAYKFIVGSS